MRSESSNEPLEENLEDGAGDQAGEDAEGRRSEVLKASVTNLKDDKEDEGDKEGKD